MIFFLIFLTCYPQILAMVFVKFKHCGMQKGGKLSKVEVFDAIARTALGIL